MEVVKVVSQAVVEISKAVVAIAIAFSAKEAVAYTKNVTNLKLKTMMKQKSVQSQSQEMHQNSETDITINIDTNVLAKQEKTVMSELISLNNNLENLDKKLQAIEQKFSPPEGG